MADDEQQEARPQPVRDRQAEKAAAAARMAHQQLYVDLRIRKAMEQGQFDNLPGEGKPIKNLGTHDDPEWWIKQLIEREKIAVLPPSLQLRKDDAELDRRLDALGAEREVREAVEEFNQRVLAARYRPAEGPPLITMPRDVEATVAEWRERRVARRTTPRPASAPAPSVTPRRRWWTRWFHQGM